MMLTPTDKLRLAAAVDTILGIVGDVFKRDELIAYFTESVKPQAPVAPEPAGAKVIDLAEYRRSRRGGLA